MTDSKRLLIAAVMVAVLLSAVSARAQAVADPEAAVARLEQAAGGSLRVTRAPGDGRVRFLAVRDGQGIAVAGGNGEARARNFLARYGDAFGLTPDQELRLVRPSQIDEIGMEHVRLQQTHRGVPVTGAELIVHLRGGRVMSASGKALSQLDRVNVTPRIAAARAAEVARALVVKYYGGDVTLSEPRLEILDLPLLGGRKKAGGLAWFVEATRLDVREFVWVDARAGFPLLHFSQLADAKNRAIYTAKNGSRLPGVLRRREGGAPAPVSAVDRDDVNKAYDFSGDTYDYFFEQHGRDSFDAKGGLIKSTIDYCPNSADCPYANAFWNGLQMVYGHGFAAADDVDAHELTHAVTERSAHLLYWMQSGALNESFSDIFGETVDQLNGEGTDTADVKWKLGEDVPVFGAIRDMKDPALFGHPGKMSEFECKDDPFDDEFDRGGVHINSGIANKAYYLMVDGATYNGMTVQGIGLVKAGKIQYRALTSYLTQASDFLDNWDALRQSCNDLIGTAGITAGDCDEVQKALDAVEMSDPVPCTPTPADNPPACPAGKGRQFVFADDLEKTNSTNWKTTVQSVGNHWTLSVFDTPVGLPKIYHRYLPASGALSFWGFDVDQSASSSIEMAKTVAVPANGFLEFKHMYSFESDGPFNYDGGVLEYSINNGATWIDAGLLITNEGQEYTGTLTPGGGNPLQGRAAFVNDSWGYVTTRLDLSTLAGQGVRFRFQIGTDSGVADYGWFVDDVQIYTCEPGGTVRFSAPGYLGTEASGKATVTVTRTGGTAPFTVDYSTADYSATAGQDYVATAGRLTFGAGVMSQTFTVPIINDTDDDDLDAGFNVFLHGVSPAAVIDPAANEADVSITDNDTAGVIQIGAPTYRVAETGTAMITVTRTGGLASGATVYYNIVSGTALPPDDYATSNGFITFAAGQTIKKIAVPIVSDTIDEEDENFFVLLFGPGGGAVIGRNNAAVTITDNDEGGVLQFKLAAITVREGVNTSTTFTVVRTGGLASAVSVQYDIQDGTATGGGFPDYVSTFGVLSFGPGETTKTFPVGIVNDAEPPVEPTETFTVSLSNPTGGATLGLKQTATVTILE